MLRKAYEIIGTELPIFEKKEEHYFSFEEIVETGNNLNDFEEAGFVKLFKGDQLFFEKIYIRKGGINGNGNFK